MKEQKIIQKSNLRKLTDVQNNKQKTQFAYYLPESLEAHG